MRRTQNKKPVKNSAPEKQTGMFQLFDLKEARAEELEAQEKARELEREEEKRKTEALRTRMAKIEASQTAAAKRNNEERKQKKAASSVQKAETAAVKKKRTRSSGKNSAGRKKAANTEVQRRTPVAPVLPKAEYDEKNAAVLSRTLDSSRNFSSVHNAARKIAVENNVRISAPKAELQGMDAYLAEMEAARKREEEERRQRLIERARAEELEKARQQEAALVKLREEEERNRRKEEEERQRALEIRRQNEEAAARWREQEAERVRAEAEKIREIQVMKAREKEAERVQQLEITKKRENEFKRVSEEEEAILREDLARFKQEEEQHQQIENNLEIRAAAYEEEGALLHESHDTEEIVIHLDMEEVPEKESESLEDVSFDFPDLPETEEDVLLSEEDVPEEETFDEAEGSQEEDKLPEEDSPDEIPEKTEDVEPASDEEPVSSEEITVREEDTDIDDDFDEEFDDLEDFEDLDDFDEEITSGMKKNLSGNGRGKSFVLPSFGKIMDSEKPRDAGKAQFPLPTERPDKGLDTPQTEEKIEIEEDSESTVLPESEETEEITEQTETEEASEVTEQTEIEEASEHTEQTETEEASETAEETEADSDAEASSDGQDALHKPGVFRRRRRAKREKTHEKKEAPLPVKADIPLKQVRKRPPKRRNRKKYDALLGKIVAALLVIVMAANAVVPDKESSEIENRELTQAPKLSLASVLDGTFADQVEDWQSDQFIGRNVLRNLQIFLRWLGGDREENGVYMGKDGQLLEEIVKADNELLTANITAMNTFAEQYSDRNFSVMLVPDAGTILSDSYPSWAEQTDQRNDFSTVQGMLSDNYQWVDVLGTLDSHTDEKLYYKTDHHWTSLGAYYAYQKYCETFGLEAGNFTANTISDTFNGVLSSTSGFCQGEKETIEMYVPESGTQELVTYTDNGTQTTTLYDKDKLETKDQYAVFLGGNYPLVDIKTTTDNDKVLLVFKDSFANCMIPFLATQYKEIVLVDPRYYYGEIDELMLTYGITDVTFLFSGNTFFDDHNLQGVLTRDADEQESAEQQAVDESSDGQASDSQSTDSQENQDQNADGQASDSQESSEQEVAGEV